MGIISCSVNSIMQVANEVGERGDRHTYHGHCKVLKFDLCKQHRKSTNVIIN